jgi:uncharacterized protein (DUF2336 family)
MIVRRFLAWSQTAPAGERADAASALARAYLYSDLAEADRREAETALTTLLDDPSPIVRRALAEAFASAAEAPHHCVVVLANDQSDVASIVLGRSPLLSDAELIDCAAVGDRVVQTAIALRPNLSASVAAAVAEIGARDAVIALMVNTGAQVLEFSLRRIVERFGHDGAVREAVLARPNLPAALRTDLVAATATALSAFVRARDWMSPERAARMTREATEKATVIIALDAGTEAGEGVRALVRHLRQSGQLTPSLVLRALLSGNIGLLEAALVELSGLPERRVAGLLRGYAGSGFAALYAKAGLPAALLPAFRAALAAHGTFQAGREAATDARLSRAMIERVLAACERLNATDVAKLMALLRRFDAEAAREEARAVSIEMITRRSPPPVRAPIEIDLGAIEAELLQVA